ncbi:uncharacterized protein LOC105214657 [Zeugodacus cucurbitae]|uniref:uncharacterized protein LOC105214657 n=1 Tax=Zeugodacus cucurbitae TaxID=28588 RepID=UPI0023D9004C|nr:uncharacterized protein LOC105214657 [Zeugodacus cucurbitae]
MYKRNCVWLLLVLCVFNSLTGDVNAATISHIAFMKDASAKPKCPLAVQSEPLQKPLVLLRVSQPSLDEADDEELAEEETNMEVSEEDDEEIDDAHKPIGFKLVELNKAQLQQLIDSGKLQLVENAGASSVGQVYNEDADDWVADDERSKKRPWRKIQRIIRRQLLKQPKRYFKKIAHQIG